MDRRTFLASAVTLLAAPLAVRAGRLFADGGGTGAGQAPSGGAAAERTAASALPDATASALESSPFVYISPLRGSGAESTCHGEVWYGWIDGAVVITTGRTTWKARSLARGLDRARLWVGDYGRWKRLLGRNEAFRAGPSFEARASEVEDAALVERLLETFARKYPDEIDRWRDRMREGHRTGERMLIRYVPTG